ncbi:hypothetical protein [Brevibacterium yomogidense]|uniref:hypothetical protein n=1 Tax=Brevibacterium yomogidense TaxID=946573 RepID=UPI0018DF51F9|nr:hypothetical protein [Brevibacterium yomogidense]
MLTLTTWKVSKPNFATPDPYTFCLLNRLDLTATGQDATAPYALFECRVIEPDDFCHAFDFVGAPRGTIARSRNCRW